MLRALADDLGVPALPLDTLESKPPTGDYLSVIEDTTVEAWNHTLGIDHRKEYHTATNRPVMIVRDGEVIRDLFA